MIDAIQYYKDHMNDSIVALEDAIFRLTGGGDTAEGVAAHYNSAAYGWDVKDDIFKLAILHLLLLSKTKDGIDAIEMLATTDKTLSVPGKAADAAAAGNRLVFDEGRISSIQKRLSGVSVLLWGDRSVLTDGKSVNYTTGELKDSENASYSDYIGLPDGISRLWYNRLIVPTSETNSGIAFYDSNKNYISGVSNVTGGEGYSSVFYRTAVPSGAAYARFTYVSSDLAGRYPPFYVSVDDSLDGSFASLEKLVEFGLGHNLPSVFADDQCVEYDTGDVISSGSGQSATNFIEIPANAENLIYMDLVVNAEDPSSGLAFYDANRNYISGIPHKTGTEGSISSELSEVSVPDNAVYVRFSYVASRLADRFDPFIACVTFKNSLLDRVPKLESAVYDGNKNVDLSRAMSKPYTLPLYGKTWVTYGSSIFRIVPLDGARSVKIQTGGTKTRYIFLTDADGIENNAEAHTPGTAICTGVKAYTTESVPVPDGATYIGIWERASDGTSTIPEKVSLCYGTEENNKKIISGPIFNLNLSKSSDYTDLSGYDPDTQTIPSGTITQNGLLMLNGFEHYVTINKYAVCDDVSYRADIRLGSEGVGICTLGTADMPGAETDDSDKPHATIVVFDFTNGRVHFKTGTEANKYCHDGTSLPVDDYQPYGLPNTMVHLSGTRYRIEIGRKKRCPYAAVYNLTTGDTCYYAELQAYATTASYGGKAGALYDLPTFAALSGSITFERVAAFVPTGVHVAFLGDSNTEGSQIAYKDVWANQIISAMNGDGLNMGRGAGTVKHMIRCATDILPVVKPKYAVVMIGSNGKDTVNTETNFNELKTAIETAGAIPIFNMFPRGTSMITPGSEYKRRSDIILGLDTEHPRFDIATSIDHDLTKAQNESLFKEDRQHLNEAGEKEVYSAFMATVGWELS